MEKCVNYGAEKVPGAESSHCHAIYARAKASYPKKRSRIISKPELKFIPCPTCGRKISKNVPACPHWGKVINPVSISKSKKAQIIGYLRVAVTAIGIFSFWTVCLSLDQ